MTPDRPCYPFAAIVGQERMKRALLAAVVDPALHGVLVRGERGTAKSTAVRALARLLPEQRVVAGCPYGCDPARPEDACTGCRERLEAGGAPDADVRSMPLVDLPIGATEDRVLGTVDIEAALTDGTQRFRPGLLAEVNRGILYIDEVNLLGDHLMDVLLDAAAMGINVVEREGVSHVHPSRFILVGTMNPEEGQLRPQLTDRFDLGVEVGGMRDGAARRDVLEHRLAFEADPAGFRDRFRDRETALADRILSARGRLGQTAVGDGILDGACALAADLELDGHRAEIAMVKAARALAALDGLTEAGAGHLEEAAMLAVPHRLRRLPLEDDREGGTRLAEAVERMSRRVRERDRERPREGTGGKKNGRPGLTGR